MALPIHFGRGFALFAAFFALAFSDGRGLHAQTPDNLVPSFEWRTLDTYEPWHAHIVRLPIDYYNGSPGLYIFGSPLVACGHSGTYASLLSSDEKDLSFALIKPKSKTIDRISVPFLSRAETVLPSSDGDVGTRASVMVRFRADKSVVYVACSEDASRLLLVEVIRVREQLAGIEREVNVMLAYGLVDVRARTVSFLGAAALPNTEAVHRFGMSESNSSAEFTKVGGNFADVGMHSIVAPQAIRERLAPLGMSVVSIERVLEAIARTANLDGATRQLIGWNVHKAETATVAIFRFGDWSNKAATCDHGKYGILDLADREPKAYACNLGTVLYERFPPFMQQSRAFFAALKDKDLCSKGWELDSRPLILGVVDKLERDALGSCRITAMPAIQGEAFSPAGRDQWVVLTQGTGSRGMNGWVDRREVQERIGLALDSVDGSHPITRSARAVSSPSDCVELETTSSTEHVFFCRDGWLIYADREVATR